jgi:uncharacterized protein
VVRGYEICAWARRISLLRLSTSVADRRVADHPLSAFRTDRQPLVRDDGDQCPFPADHAAFIECCPAAGQTRPTPLLLQYGKDDHNWLHQDIYGEHIFPLQVTVLLSEPGRDFEGGEFVLTEQCPRMPSRAAVVPLKKSDAVVFAVNSRPIQSTRGAYRVNLRHGVSKLRSGHRHTPGIIFHDAA